MFCHNNKAFLFGLPKDAAGAAFKRWLRLLALANNKIGSGSNSTLKELAPGGSRRLRLRNTSPWIDMSM